MSSEDSPAGEEAREQHRRGRVTGALAVLVVLLVLAAGAAMWWQNGRGPTAPSDDEVPLVRADPTPAKSKPDDPGGMPVPNRDKLVYRLMSPNPPPPPKEVLIPAPAAEAKPAAAEDDKTAEDDAGSDTAPAESDDATAKDDAPPPAPIKPAAPTTADGARELLNLPPPPPQPERALKRGPDAPAEPVKPVVVATLSPPPGAREAPPPQDEPAKDEAEPAAASDTADAPADAENAEPATSDTPASETNDDEPKRELIVAAKPDDDAPPSPPTPPAALPDGWPPIPGDRPAEIVALAEAKPEPAPAPAPTPPPAAPATPAMEDAFRIQIAAFRDAGIAEKEWARLQKIHAAALGALEPHIVTVDLGQKGLFHRLQAGPLTSRAAALATCTELKAAKQDCIIVPRSERAAAIVGVAGTTLTAEERDLIAGARPLGFILFKRNCESPAQISALTAALRAAVDDDDAPVLIDQEGGRVRRLQGPPWHDAPPAAVFARLAPEDGTRAAWLNSRLIADDLTAMGVDVDCVPCLDLSFAETHKVIGDRSYGTDVGTVVRLGGAAAAGLKAGGVMPVMKHLPGHGRATVDSHDAPPVVEADLETLTASDFAPFASLTDEIELGMTGHLMFPAIDPLWPSTLSATIVSEVIRDRIGFQGLLMSDDLSMQALAGDVGERAAGAIAAGCDVALHCNGRFDEMSAVLAACGPMSAPAHDRWTQAKQGIPGPEPFDRAAAQQELASLLASLPGPGESA